MMKTCQLSAILGAILVSPCSSLGDLSPHSPKEGNSEELQRQSSSEKGSLPSSNNKHFPRVQARARHRDILQNELPQVLPSFQEQAQCIEEIVDIFLSIDSLGNSSNAAGRLKNALPKLQMLNARMNAELQLYVDKQQAMTAGYNPAGDPLLETYASYLQSRFVLFGIELVSSITAQGLMTPELGKSLQFAPPAIVPEEVSMSPKLQNYWKEKMIQQNRRNRILYSLRTENDIPRVQKELGICAAALRNLEKKERSPYPLQNEQDKAADQVMRRREASGPIRIANVLTAVLKSRGLLERREDGTYVFQGMQTIIDHLK